ncbi:hypothetical protein GQ55_8G201900 [Panicum hallii var. hallii]|uniref:Growth-regulating factor n=1 Tax=Panicum hallii var. hallii TaxID=1504633 RepID=A0A2T7CPB1_9POAL|nr:hypothetical protein GQ55_8G201900 [Panicum hallii var. hallii]
METGREGFFGAAERASPPPPSCSFLGSAAATTGSGGAQMLSFSSSGAAGLGLSSGASKMQGVLSRVRGPFTPTQWMELEHQALIYKHFAVNAPVPSSLLLPIRRSINPWSGLGSSSLVWTPFRPGSGDAEPGRCRRTDGKKWRCSRDAVGDQKYCERHIKRNCHRSRKHVESRKATPTIAEPSLAVSGGPSLHSYAVPWQQQVKSSAANVTDPFSRESNRKLLEKQNVHSQLSVSTPMDSFDFSTSGSSQNRDIVALSPVEFQHDHDQAYLVHGVGSSAENDNDLQESLLLVSRETLDDGPLGTVHLCTLGVTTGVARIASDD